MNPKVYLFSTSSHPDAISINSLDITLLKPDIDFFKYDYFIVTSKQTSLALRQYTQNKIFLKDALCVSDATAKAYKKIGGNSLEIGGGYGDDLSLVIQKYPKNTKWLYLRAKVVASNFVQICKEKGFNIDEEIVYESKCSKDLMDVTIEKDATLIFTSPSSVKCFMQNNTITSLNKVIVIGQTTALALAKDISYQLAKEKTIESCLNLI